MGYAILPLDLRGIADALQLPETHQLISVQYDMQRQQLSFLVESAEIPETQDYASLPTMSLHVKIEQGSGFRKTTTTPVILDGR